MKGVGGESGLKMVSVCTGMLFLLPHTVFVGSTCQSKVSISTYVKLLHS